MQRQRQKLIDEGILFDQKGRISFEQFGWAPEYIYMDRQDKQDKQDLRGSNELRVIKP